MILNRLSSKKLPPPPPPSPLDENRTQIKAKMVEILQESGGIISTTKQVSPPKDLQTDAHFEKSGMSEVVEILSDYRYLAADTDN
jgi:hypothetical protein